MLENSLDIILYFKNERNVSFISYAGNLNLTKLLAEHGADVNTKDNNAIAPLHIAAAHGNSIIMHLAMTKLWFRLVFVSGDSNVVAFLIEVGANINIIDNDKETPLHKAVSHGIHNLSLSNKGKIWFRFLPIPDKVDTARILIEHGADVNAKNYNGDTPLNLAENSKLLTLLHF